nr:hypothetical protein [Bradyrhizobium brasilense]
MAIDGSRTMFEMLRSWVIITRFAEDRYSRMSCPLLIQIRLAFGQHTWRHQILDRRRATECKLPGVDATAIRAGQDLSDRNPVGTERFADPLGLLNAAGGKVYFLGAVSGREVPDPFSHIDVGMAQQDNHAASLQCHPGLFVIAKSVSGRDRQRTCQSEEDHCYPAAQD